MARKKSKQKSGKLKLKTHKGLAKRVKLTATGKVVRHKAHRRHLLVKKSAKHKRSLRNTVTMNNAYGKKAAVLIRPKY